MKIKLSKGAQLGAWKVLTTVYGKAFAPEEMRLIVNYCASWDDDDFLAAVDGHVVDPEAGKWKPRPNDLIRQREALWMQRKAEEDRREDAKRTAAYRALHTQKHEGRRLLVHLGGANMPPESVAFWEKFARRERQPQPLGEGLDGAFRQQGITVDGSYLVIPVRGDGPDAVYD